MDNLAVLALIILGVVGISSGLVTLWLNYQDLRRARTRLLTGAVNATLDLHYDILQVGQLELNKTQSGRKLAAWQKEDFAIFRNLISGINEETGLSSGEISQLKKRYDDISEMQEVIVKEEEIEEKDFLIVELRSLLQTSEAVRNRIQDILSDSETLDFSDFDDEITLRLLSNLSPEHKRKHLHELGQQVKVYYVGNIGITPFNRSRRLKAFKLKK